MNRLCSYMCAAIVAGMLAACADAPSSDGFTPQDRDTLDAAAQKLDAERADLPGHDAQKDHSAAE